jgi:hypothetical protein
MLSKVLETFMQELDKESNKKIINEFARPYIYELKLYVSLICMLQLLILLMIGYHLYIVSRETSFQVG